MDHSVFALQTRLIDQSIDQQVPVDKVIHEMLSLLEADNISYVLVF